MVRTDLGDAARRWLSPGPASPWRIDDAGDTLVWRDGETVAFRAEVEEALRRVVRGLEIVPPGPAVAILCAAARAEGRSISSAHWDLVRDAMEAASPWLLARVAAAKEVAETASALRVLQTVDEELFARPDALPFLVEAVFEGAELPRDPRLAAAFLADLDAEPTPGTAQPTEDDARRQATEWGEALAALRKGLGRLDPATLARRARTGLDHEVGAAELDWPDAEGVRGLLAALRDDPELGAVTRLAADATAAVRLPRPGRLPEDLPIGGHADLTNRGSPERLLVSELAHDGLTLAVRVALHEALYLRREAPPHAPRGTRCVLLDSGIRLWGVGRVLATAVGLALGATSSKGTAVRVWRACGKRLDPVDLGSRAGLETHLEALRPEPDPGAALQPFFAQCDALEGPVECCVVLHANGFAEPAVREALRKARRVVHVVTVSATGDVALHAVSSAGSQVLRTARLDLDEVLIEAPRAAGRRPTVAVRDLAAVAPDLPAILRLDRLPLRVAHTTYRTTYREAPGHGVVARTSDRRLVLWTEPDIGPIELADHTPPGTLRDFCVRADVVHLVSVGGSGIPARWMRTDLVEGSTETLELPSIGKTPQAAMVFGSADEAVGLITKRTVHYIDQFEPSRIAGQIALPTGAWHRGGRLFSGGASREWWTLAHRGDSAVFEPITIPDGPGRICAVFERYGRDGLWILRSDPFRVVCSSTGDTVVLPQMDAPDFHFAAVASSGNRILFWSPSTKRRAVVDLSGSAPRFLPVAGRTSDVPEPMVESLRFASVRRHARYIGCDADGGLRIDERCLSLNVRGELSFEGADGPSAPAKPPLRWSHRAAPGHAWKLQCAHLSDGGRVFLDSRGLIHLISSDTSVPEVTLVHCDGPVAGWCSDGVMHGPRYFLGDAPSVPADEFLRRVRRVMERFR